MDHTFSLHDPSTGKYIDVAIPRELMVALLHGWCINTPENLAVALAGGMPV